MSAVEVLGSLEEAILRVCSDIKRKKATPGSDKLNSLSTLVNAYSRLLDRNKKMEGNPLEDGDPSYYQELLDSQSNDSG